MNELIEKIEKYIDEVCFGYDLPGLAVGVGVGFEDEGGVCASSVKTENILSSSEKMVFSSSQTCRKNPICSMEFVEGYADFENKIPLQNNSVFHLASIAKLFVGVAIMQLVEVGKLSLEDKLVDVLPEFKMDATRVSEISIEQLLSHTSGMPDVEDYGWKTPQFSKSALMDYACSNTSNEISNLRLMKPGIFSYSNIGYDILGAVIEQLSGFAFEDYMAKHIFIPLGMRDTTFLTPLRHDVSRFVKPHCKDENKQTKVQSYYPYNRIHAPSSTLTSTLKDISKFGAGISNNHILSRTTLQKMLTPQAQIPGDSKQQIGLSWFIRKQDGYTFYGHEGSDDGFRSSLWLCPELNMQITVLSNIDRAPVKRISKAITKIIIDEVIASRARQSLPLKNDQLLR